MGLNIGFLVTSKNVEWTHRPSPDDLDAGLRTMLHDRFPEAGLDGWVTYDAEADRYRIDVRVGGYGKHLREHGHEMQDVYGAIATFILASANYDGLVLESYFAP